MKVSSLSFGASSLGGAFHDLKEKEGIQAVFTAIEAGMNFIDVSPYYGHYKAETVLGKALKDIPRDRYYLSTKVGRYGKDGVNTWDYSAKRATESVYESMERLNIDFIDLINVHDIEFADLNQVVNETLPALVELRELLNLFLASVTIVCAMINWLTSLTISNRKKSVSSMLLLSRWAC